MAVPDAVMVVAAAAAAAGSPGGSDAVLLLAAVSVDAGVVDLVEVFTVRRFVFGVDSPLNESGDAGEEDGGG